MRNTGFRQKEPMQKTRQCGCGASAKLVKRRNYPYGQESDRRTTMAYRCSSCKKEIPLTKQKEVRR